MVNTGKRSLEEGRLRGRLQDAAALLRAIMAHDGGAYDLEPRQSYAILNFLGGGDGKPFTPAQIAGENWTK
jgi:hypothetical protein